MQRYDRAGHRCVRGADGVLRFAGQWVLGADVDWHLGDREPVRRADDAGCADDSVASADGFRGGEYGDPGGRGARAAGGCLCGYGG